MRILLLNDNPVVRKLVALSAQKTKDELSVVWSVDEIEHDEYDLLIVDDAYYSDEIMAALNEKISYKTNLLMATRGNNVPDGFDKVINKPFLPTDLVELFAAIEKNLSSAVPQEKEKSKEMPKIELDDILDGFDDVSFSEAAADELLDLEDDAEMSELESNILLDIEELDEDHFEGLKTNVLDHEEVQELQDLLEDTDTFGEDEEFMIESLELDDEEPALDEISSAENLDDLDLLEEYPHEDKLDDLISDFVEDTKDSMLDDELLGEDLLLEEIAPQKSEEAAEDLDDLMLMEEDDLGELERGSLSDDEFDDLEQQIQDAVGELDLDDLSSTLDETELSEFGLDELDAFDQLEGLDSIDEREIKLAIGEPVEEELSVRVGSGEHASLDTEALSEAMGNSSTINFEDEAVVDTPVSVKAVETKSSPAEGMEALQALLRALSNDEVVASLKGLNINININIGNEK